MRLEPIISPYEEAAAACQVHDPRTVDVAERVRSAIIAHLPEIRVEHIGSTAVAGCDGKGIVDLMVLYERGHLEEVKTLLDALGFQRQKSRDPFPEDRPMRVGSIGHDGKLFRLHVHVIQADSDEAKQLLGFRDLLRADARLRADYIARKREIIESGVTDSVDYSIEKGTFIKQALANGAATR